MKKLKSVKHYLKNIVLDPMPYFLNTQSYMYFEVTQKGRRETYVSGRILCWKNKNVIGYTCFSATLLGHFEEHIQLGVWKVWHWVKHNVFQVEFNWFLFEALAIHDIICDATENK